MRLKPRVIPVLLYRDGGLYKTAKFKSPVYVGDPINAVKIFNDKEVDELIFLDIGATAGKRRPDFDYITKIAGECFMPLCYGGGIRSLADAKAVISCGVEKVAINSYAVERPGFIKEVAAELASSTVVVAIDAKKNYWGKYQVYTRGATRRMNRHPVEVARQMEEMGAGEVLINSIDRDGTQAGYDLELVEEVARSVSIPVVACGGAGKVSDFARAQKASAAAVAAGSMFVFHGRHRAVLINFPSQQELEILAG